MSNSVNTKDSQRIEHFASEVLGLKTPQAIKAFQVMCSNAQVFDRKQQDYGSRNISDFGELGVLVRTNDKVQRIRNLLGQTNAPSNESIEDSWLDLANYGIIGYLVHKDLWK